MSEEAIIGLEVHVQLNTLRTKLFCSCPSDYRGKPPNTNVCPVCLGLPGALPVVNKEAVIKAIKVALALNCKISNVLIFSRKHYFYPDMTKNYQISQYEGVGGIPIAYSGFLTMEVEGRQKRVRIRRINIEEDPGRIVYPTGSLLTSTYTLIDYNRAGIGLLEIVTEPDLRTPKEARLFIEKLKSILEHLDVCNCDLEGALRVDANVSIPGGSRVEIKNIGSPKEVERALAYEILRQKHALMRGEIVRRETRHWDSVRKVTVSMRVKEFEEDYRYFPDPDLPPIPIPKDLIEKVNAEMPELPDERIERFVSEYGLTRYEARVLVMNKKLADYFEDVVRLGANVKKTVSILINDFIRYVNELNLSLSDALRVIKPVYIKELVDLLNEGVISTKIMKKVLPEMFKSRKSPKDIVKELGLIKISDVGFIKRVVDEVFNEYPKAVQDALINRRAIEFLVGQVMKKTRGRADPLITRRLIEEKLSKLRSG
ncbi:MAG TPA: Asp-tRNA(Asn)/Glu-tRNA(Gln) amidotransferase subunit GatB [Acidilobales archaeon]|nr:Asp-tRNA(Asn)/Glu-tRNA(Gln) amidotransferase subunit GatB [Acidilobales archaeon]